MRRQRLTLMILEINIKYKILSKQFFLILGGGVPSVCLVCHVGNPVPERGVQGPPTPCPPAPAQEIAAGGRTGVPAQARLRPRLCVPGGDSEDRNKERRAGVT